MRSIPSSHENGAGTESLFVSYSRHDRKIIAPFVRLMRLAKSPVFQDLDSIEPGRKWRIELAASIASASRIVVFWCSHSAESENVEWEWQEGRRLGKELVPARMDSTPLHPDLAEYQGFDLRPAVIHARPRYRAWLALGMALVALAGLGAVLYHRAEPEPILLAYEGQPIFLPDDRANGRVPYGWVILNRENGSVLRPHGDWLVEETATQEALHLHWGTLWGRSGGPDLYFLPYEASLQEPVVRDPSTNEVWDLTPFVLQLPPYPAPTAGGWSERLDIIFGLGCLSVALIMVWIAVVVVFRRVRQRSETMRIRDTLVRHLRETG